MADKNELNNNHSAIGEYQASYIANPKSTADIERENYQKQLVEYQQNAQQYQQQWYAYQLEAYQQQIMMAYGQYGQPGQPIEQGGYPQQGNTYMQNMHPSSYMQQGNNYMQQNHHGQPQSTQGIPYNYQQINIQQNNGRGRFSPGGRGKSVRPDYYTRADNRNQDYRSRGANQYNRQDNNSWVRGRGGLQRGNQIQYRSSTIGAVHVAPGIKVETSPLYCVNCDREFNNEGNFKIHLGSHVKCSFCPFEGHPKIISNHEKSIHGPNGIKLPSLDTPEEIEAWREERRRKFPTKSNIEEKLSLNMNKLDQSDIVEESVLNKNRSSELLPSSAYIVPNPKKKRKICSFYQKGRCKKGDDCAFAHEILETFPAELMPSKKVTKTLFERLNESDMKNERNIILQCIRYIVEKNFFISSHDTAVKFENLSSSDFSEEGELDSSELLSGRLINLENSSE